MLKAHSLEIEDLKLSHKNDKARLQSEIDIVDKARQSAEERMKKLQFEKDKEIKRC